MTCAVLSVAAHALAVTLMPPLERPAHTLQPGAKAGARPLAWHMRIEPAPRPSVTTAGLASSTQATHTTPPLAAETQTPTETASPDTTWPDSLPDVIDTPETQPEPLPEVPVQASMEAVPSDQPIGAGLADIEGNSEYIPRPQLSVPPVAQAPLILAAPEGQFEPQRITGILSLYIDENGRVHHVLAHGERMPTPFEEAARQAFMAMTFRPGQLNGQAVKSRIRVEVVFDNTPLTTDTTQP